MSSSTDCSIVEYYNDNEGYRCGYCKSPNTNYSNGMWAHSLTVQDYQDLIDRGWRRSGCYCYKPMLNRTCCPMYTIKCSVLDFKLSKSQKKKIKRFNKFLASGQIKTVTEVDGSETNSEHEGGLNEECPINDTPGLKNKIKRSQENARRSAVVHIVKESLEEKLTVIGSGAQENLNSEGVDSTLASKVCDTLGRADSVTVNVQSTSNTSSRKMTRPGDGMDPSRPQCKKAKLLRLERKKNKIAQLALPLKLEKTKTAPGAKYLEDFLNEAPSESPAHRLEIRLVCSCPASREFKSTFKQALDLYRKYQMAIHNDPLKKLTETQFTRFLVNSPLQPFKPRVGPPQGYGSFHQQYWLDDHLIAVGVVDILPSCVSSVYFFYDPEYHSLVLGTYGSLREIAFCRSLHHTAPALRYYYMGFYIHSCPKMRYKGAYTPSFLLCPEVYTWHPIESCIIRLESRKYSRFNDDPSAKDIDLFNNVHRILILFRNKAITYKKYRSLNESKQILQTVTQYATLVGNRLSKRLLLLLNE